MSRVVSMQYRVPYADTDQMSVVYYANYLIYFEMCRAELLRSIGFSYTKMEEEGFALPVIEAVCRYKSSAHFEDLLTITATVAEAKGVRLQVNCQVLRDGEVLAEGHTIHVCLNTKRGNRPTKIPEDLLTLFLS